jgi:flagellar biosynthesis protein FlhG
VAEAIHDQAAGLRRLFGGRHLRLVTFLAAAAGVGKTEAIAGLAVALAAQGRQVLVVDENEAEDGLAERLGKTTALDLLDVIGGRCQLCDALYALRPGVRLLTAARAAGALGDVAPARREALLRAVALLAVPPDVVLVDARHDHPLGFSPFALATSEAVVVLTGQPAAITSAYALIKDVSQRFGRRRLRVLINRARSTADAEQVYANLARVAGQRDLAALDLAAAIPVDDAFRRARVTGRSVLEAFPDSPAAVALRHFAAELLHWPCEDDPEGFEALMRQLLHLSQHIKPRARALR